MSKKIKTDDGDVIDTNSDGIISPEELDLQISSKRWKNRRRMAWLSLFSILVVTYYMLFKIEESRIEVLDSVVTWFYTVMGSIVGAYVGFSTLEDIKSQEK